MESAYASVAAEGVAPSPALRERLLALTDHSPEAFDALVAEVAATGSQDERPPVDGPSCRDCDVTMLLPWEGPDKVSIREVDGWTFTTDTGWLCPSHSGRSDG